jgi:hypothetical protein
MKTKLLLLLTLICISFYGNAQSKEALKNSTSEQRAKWLSDTMQTTLHLNADQYSKVYSINLAFAQKAQPIMQSDDNKLSKFKQLKDMQDKRDEGFKAVLTKDQYNLYEEKKDAMIGTMKEKYKGKR